MSKSGKGHGPVLYLGVWLGLVLLTTATFLIGQVELGAWQMPVGLLIAAVKGTLVVLFFMHLIEQSHANRLVFVTSLVFVALLIAFAVGDVALRFRPTQPPGPIPLDLTPGSPGMQLSSPSDLGPPGTQRR